MALRLCLDLNNSTFADLAALVEAARTAGVSADARIDITDHVLSVTSTGDPVHTRASQEKVSRPSPSAGSDAALKFIAELLGGQDRGGRR